MNLPRIGILTLLSTLPLWGQGVSGTIRGEIVDPGSAAVVNANVTLTSSATQAVLRTTTNTSGVFVFPSVAGGTYELAAEAHGFRKSIVSGITLSASEIRDLGRLQLVLGEVRETVSVTDTIAPLQTASGERSGLLNGSQLNSLALKGRDFLGLATLMPGVVDDGSQARQTTSAGAIGGIYINGNRAETKNFTVDGVTDVDTGSGATTMHYEPNMDSIAEVKVLTSNYQAEFGRSAGGLISVVTKNGTREFHGSGWWTHRHEQFNANNFFNNRTGLPNPPYRYNIAGFSIGGPVYIPKKFNADKSKIFFFASQEYTRQKVNSAAQYDYMPTALERGGDFSRSLDSNGKLITIRDPTTGSAFPGNIIPLTRINPLGQSILKFFPMPNYVDPNPALVNTQNYQAVASGSHPRRNDMVRVDVYPSSKLNGYFRWINDYDSAVMPFYGFNFAYTNFITPDPGHGYAGHITYTATSTLLNEFILGKSWNSVQQRPMDPTAENRNLLGNPPQLFPNQPRAEFPSEAIDAQMMPGINFGSTPVNPPSIGNTNNQHVNHNDTWDFTDNLNYVTGEHRFKSGFYFMHTDKVQVQGLNWNGTFNFASNASNPFDTGDGFSNALIGSLNNYTENTSDGYFHATYYNLEFYVQDNWKVTKRLTLDYGIRFYHVPPQVDQNHSVATFDPQTFKLSAVPQLYRPGLDANGNRVAVDPLTGATTYAALIGAYVPGSGNFANGMNVAGVNGYPWGVYSAPALTATPRFGFAFDLTGKGTTVIRGGAGIFIDRTRQLITAASINQPPLSYTATVYYGNLSTFAQSSGALGPTNITYIAPAQRAQQPSVANFSLSIQHQLPIGMVADVSYVGSLSSHLLDTRNLNVIPLGSRLIPANADPTSPGKPLPDNFFRPYPGLADLNAYEFASSANYNSLQASLQRRFGHRFGLGISYTFSKTLGVANSYGSLVSSYFSPRRWNYGPLSFDRSQVFTVDYQYGLPNPGARLNNAVLKAVADAWTVSGVTTFMAGAPFTPSLTTTTSMEISGSAEAARITVVGDPKLDKSAKSFTRNFNTAAFALTPVGSFGNAGVNILRGPGINNWDISLGKKIPVGLGEGRGLEFRAEAYNAWNHTQFSSLDTTARFNPAGSQVNQTFGWDTAARSARVLSFALRFAF
jgi:hypothetical protein